MGFIVDWKGFGGLRFCCEVLLGVFGILNSGANKLCISGGLCPVEWGFHLIHIPLCFINACAFMLQKVFLVGVDMEFYRVSFN